MRSAAFDSGWPAFSGRVPVSVVLLASYPRVLDHVRTASYSLDRSRHHLKNHSLGRARIASCVYIMPNIAWVVAHPPDPPVDRRLADMQVRFYGATAIVTGSVIRPRDGSELGRNVFTDVFALSDGRWEAVSAEETPVAKERGRTG